MADAPLPPLPPLLPNETPPVPNRKPLIIVSSILVLLVVAGAAAYYFVKQLTPAPVVESSVPSASPVVEEVRDIPALNTTGTTNPAKAEDTRLALAAKDPATFADLNNTMSPENLYRLLKERLGLKTDDTDNDGSGDLAELLIYGTNPFYHDSDLDGQTDGAEVAANTWTQDEQVKIAARKAYWKTDFALSADRQKQSDRDLTRIGQAGEISLLLMTYYNQNSSYPVATTWVEAWDEMEKSGATRLLGTSATAFNDPLNQAPYVYSYTGTTDTYTFTYSLEGSQKTLTQQSTNGTTGPVTESTISTQPAPQKTSWLPTLNLKSLIERITPIAQAITYGSGVATTTDGHRVKVFGDLGWVEIANHLPLIDPDNNPANNNDLINGFLNAANHGGGYCTKFDCFCSNGTSLAFGKNDSACGPASAPTQVTTGQKFPVSITMQNLGVFWSAGYNLGFWKKPPGGTDDVTFGVGRATLSKIPTLTGESAKFDFTATAPTVPGKYYLAGRMVEEGVEWFGAICPATPDGFITVVDAPKPACSDTVDNDADKLIDAADPGCHSDNNALNAASYVPSDPDETDGISAAATPTATTPPATAAPTTPVVSSSPSSSPRLGSPTPVPTNAPTAAPTPTFNPGGFKEGD